MNRWLILFAVFILAIIALVGVTESFRPPSPVRDATPASMGLNNLKIIGVALHEYAEEHQGRLPPPAVFKDGKPLLSWRVLLLPYIERMARSDGIEWAETGLYQRFKLDEPWDSETNLPLLERIPRVYQSPKRGSMPPLATPYQAFVGKGTAFEGKEGVSLADFPDGIDTVLVAEVAEGVPWTKPQDIEFDQPFPPFGNVRREQFMVLMHDLGVRGLRKDIGRDSLRAFVTRNAGDDPGKDW